MIFWRNWSSHQQRWVTALLVAVPLVAVLGWAPVASWVAVVVLAAGLGLWEVQGLVLAEGLPTGWQALYFSAAVGMPLAAYGAGAGGLHAALVLWLFAGFAAVMRWDPLDRLQLDRLSRVVLAWLYVPYLLSYVLLLARSDTPRRWIFFTLLALVAGDVGAYYTGKTVGRRKLNPRVSPNKTVEGSIGGLIAATLVGTVFGFAFGGGRSVIALAATALVLELVGQMGDLIESMLKRMFGKKDSSHLLPGHGGILDRLDSLLFAFPLTWLILQM